MLVGASVVGALLSLPAGSSNEGLLQELVLPARVGAPLYVALSPVKDETQSPEVAALAERLVKSELAALGATFAPPEESPAAALAVIQGRKMQGWTLLLKLRAHESKGAAGIRVDAVCMTYPQQELRGAVNVKAAGRAPAELLKLMVPRLISDTAHECDWAGP